MVQIDGVWLVIGLTYDINFFRNKPQLEQFETIEYTLTNEENKNRLILV